MATMKTICPVCGMKNETDLGDVVWMQSFFAKSEMKVVCDKCRPKYEKDKVDYEAEMKRRELQFYYNNNKDRIIEESQLPVRFLEEWDYQKGNNQLLKFVHTNKEKSLYICSKTSGICKTRAVAVVAKSMLDNSCGKITVQFWKATFLMRKITGLYGQSVEEADKFILNLRNIDLLIIDDLGKEKTTERVEEILFDVIDERYAYNKRTWITSNFDGEEIEKIFGLRGKYLRRRINEDYKFWTPSQKKEDVK